MSRVAYPFGHFPVEVTHGTPSTSDNPIGLSLAEAMRWYWLIRQATVKVTLSGRFTLPNGSSLTASNTAASNVLGVTYIDYPYQLVTDETQLCLGTGIGLSVSRMPPDPSTVSQSASGQPSVSASIFLGTFGVSTVSGITPLFLSGGLYYPAVYFGAAISITGNLPNNNTVTYTVYGSTRPGDSDTTAVQGTATFFGHALSLSYGVSSNSGVADSFSGLRMDVEVTDSAEWAYAD